MKTPMCLSLLAGQVIAKDDSMLLLQARVHANTFDGGRDEGSAHLLGYLQNTASAIVNGTATPDHIPADTLLNEMKIDTTSMIDAFIAENTADEGKLQTMSDDIDTKYMGDIKDANGEKVAAKTAHDDCRSAEHTAFDNEATKCQAFTNHVSQALICGASATNYATLQGTKADDPIWAAELVTKQKACRDDTAAAVMYHEGECGRKQLDFEDKWCHYKSEAKDGCAAITAFNTETTAVGERYERRKNLVLGGRKIVCLIDILQKAKSESITASDVQACDAIVNDMAAFTYPVLSKTCDDNTDDRPGIEAWKTSQYGVFSPAIKDRLAAVTSCPNSNSPESNVCTAVAPAFKYPGEIPTFVEGPGMCTSGNGDRAFATWARFGGPVTESRNSYIMSEGAKEQDNCHGEQLSYLYRRNNDGKVTVGVWGSCADAWLEVPAAYRPEGNEWQFLAYSLTGIDNTWKFYINGHLIGSKAHSRSEGLNVRCGEFPSYLGVPRHADLELSRFGGAIKNARYYNTAITSEDVQCLFKLGQ